jgi:hypothetical protein
MWRFSPTASISAVLPCVSRAFTSGLNESTCSTIAGIPDPAATLSRALPEGSEADGLAPEAINSGRHRFCPVGSHYESTVEGLRVLSCASHLEGHGSSSDRPGKQPEIDSSPRSCCLHPERRPQRVTFRILLADDHPVFRLGRSSRSRPVGKTAPLDFLKPGLVQPCAAIAVPLHYRVFFIRPLNCAQFPRRSSEIAEPLDAISGIQLRLRRRRLDEPGLSCTV